MNENETFDLLTTAEADTVRLGQKLAHFAQKGDTFALFGTLGMGKSVLARAFIRELTGAKEVPSPTFTLLQSYEAPDFEIYHFDLYRLKSPEEIFEIGMEDALYGGVCLIEWPEQMGGYLPRDVFRVEFQPEGQGRRITIRAVSPQKQQRLQQLKAEIND